MAEAQGPTSFAQQAAGSKSDNEGSSGDFLGLGPGRLQGLRDQGVAEAQGPTPIAAPAAGSKSENEGSGADFVGLGSGQPQAQRDAGVDWNTNDCAYFLGGIAVECQEGLDGNSADFSGDIAGQSQQGGGGGSGENDADFFGGSMCSQQGAAYSGSLEIQSKVLITVSTTREEENVALGNFVRCSSSQSPIGNEESSTVCRANGPGRFQGDTDTFRTAKAGRIICCEVRTAQIIATGLCGQTHKDK